jgi:glycosyltransferase involved in cell wall biosynthesis
MNVWLFTMSQRIHDAENTRTFLLARHLRTQGCEVTLWTSAFDHMKKEFRRRHGQVEVLPNGVRAIYLGGCGYRTNVSVRRYVDHWMIARRLSAVAATQPRPDVAVVSLPDHQLAHAAVSFLRRRRVPVVVDVRDQWPDIFLSVIRRPLVRFAARTLLWRDRRMVRRTIAQADATVSMMDSLLRWGCDLAARPAGERDRVFYLATNPALPRELPLDGVAADVRTALTRIGARPFHLFVGTFGIYYNPLLLIAALREMRARGHQPRFDVVIGGTGTNFEEVKAAASEFPHVHLTGWLGKRDIDVLVSRAATGIIPCNLPIHAFPNKAFTYLSGGLPVISSVGGDLQDAVAQRRVGLDFPAGDAAALATCLTRLENDPALLASLSANAAQFFAAELDSDRTYSAYAAHVRRLAERVSHR